jgi:hypothetical protein
MWQALWRVSGKNEDNFFAWSEKTFLKRVGVALAR